MLKHFFLNICILITNLAFAQKGLIGEYYNGTYFNQKIAVRFDAKINFSWYSAPFSGIDPTQFSVRWKGKLIPPETGKYKIGFVVDDGVRLYINNKLVLDAWRLNNKVFFSQNYFFEKGKEYDIVILYYNGMLEGLIDFKWELPSKKPKFDGFFGSNEETIGEEYFAETNFNKPAEMVEKKEPIEPIKKPVLRKREVSPIKEVKKMVTPPKDSIIKYIPKNILFRKSTDIMIGNSEKELKDLSSFLKKYPQLKVKINGHTDIFGDSALNVKLSQQRALAVKKYLISVGIDSNRLSSQGFGFNNPVQNVSNKNGVNRRVEFIIE